MEDAATAEISRTQVWQWVHHPDGRLDDGRDIDADLFRTVMQEELRKIRELAGEARFETFNYELASELFDDIISNPELEEFLTLKAYDHLK
jgi:malate synthase